MSTIKGVIINKGFLSGTYMTFNGYCERKFETLKCITMGFDLIKVFRTLTTFLYKIEPL